MLVKRTKCDILRNIMDVNAKTDCEVGKVKYLKWKNDVIAEINSDYSVDFLTEQGALFTNPDSLITHWSR